MFYCRYKFQHAKQFLVPYYYFCLMKTSQHFSKQQHSNYTEKGNKKCCTFLTVSSCSRIADSSWPCLCLISAMWFSWLEASSSRDFLREASSCSRLLRSSCWAAVVSRESSSSFFSASSSSFRSRFCFSALLRAAFSASRSS